MILFLVADKVHRRQILTPMVVIIIASVELVRGKKTRYVVDTEILYNSVQIFLLIIRQFLYLIINTICSVIYE